MKKIISLILSMTFVFSILPAFAEGTEGTPMPQIDAVVQETDKQDEQIGDRLEKQIETEGTAQPTEPGTAVETNQNETTEGQPQEETASNAENGEPQVPITKPSGQAISYEEDFGQFETNRFLVKKEDGIHVLKTDEKKNAQEFIDETRAQDATILYMQPDYPLELSAVKDGWAFTGGEEMRCAEAEPEAVFMADRMNLTYHAFRFGTGFEGVQDNVTGLGTVVAVLDTGMDTSQIQNLYQNRDEAEGDMDSDGNGYVGDLNGWDFTRDVPAVNEQETRFDQWHATAVAGIITATAPDAELLPLQIFRDGTGYTSDALRAIDYCKSTGICIVNCSWISRERNSLLEESMADSDILFVCAAGNGGINLDEVPIYPASYDLDNVITVASVNQYGALSAFSNYSERKVDIAAPGEEITISGVEDADAHLSGTSLSAAFVSAAAAMVLEREPARSPADVKETIKRSAMKLCSLDGKVSGAGTLNYQNIVNGIQEETYRYFKRNEQLMNNEFGDGASPMSLQQPLTSKAASEPSGWRPCGEMPKAAADMASAVVDGKVYVFGGKMGSTVSDEVYCFDPAANTWTLVSTMPLGRYKHRAVEMNGKIYLCAGYQSGATTVSQIDVYDPQSNTWEDALQTPDNRTSYAAGAYAGFLYVFGGRISSSATKTVYSYDSATGEWTQEASIIKEVIDEQTIQSEHGIRVFSHWDVIEYTGAGGYIVDHYHRELEEYAAISRPVYDHKSSDGSYGYIVPDAIYMTGGRDRGDGKPRGICRIRYTGYLDPEPEWYHDREMVRALYRHNIVLAGDYLYVFGGIGLDGTQQNTVYRRNIYEYPDDHTSPKEIKENQTFSGSVNFPSDGDVFTFTPTETGKYELKRLPAMHSNKQNYLLYLWIREGEKQLYAEYFDCAGGVWMEAGKTYSFEVGDTTVDYTGNYTLKLVRVPASEDVPDVKDRAAPLIIGKEITETVMGILDQDYFYFDAPNDGTYKLSFGLEQTLSQYDRKSARIKLYDESGAVKYDLGTYEILNKAIELEAGRYTIGIVPSPYYDETRPGYTIKLDFVESVNRMLSERAKHRLLSVNNKLYAIGGVDSGFNVLDSIEEYDRAANTWKRTTQIPAPRKGMSTVAVGRKIYLLGGYEGSDYSRRVDIYDTLTKQWTQGGDILVAREKAGAALIDGKIYLAGGRDAEGYSRTVEVYDTATNTVTHQFNLPDYNGILSGMAFCGDGKLYLAGGIDKDGYSNQVYCYNGSTWEIKAQMPYQAVYADGTMHGNEFVCAAAADGKVKVLTYTPSADTWQELYSDWNPYVTDYAVGCIGDELFLMGGYYGDTFEADTRVCDLKGEEAQDSDVPARIYSNELYADAAKREDEKETDGSAPDQTDTREIKQYGEQTRDFYSADGGVMLNEADFGTFPDVNSLSGSEEQIRRIPVGTITGTLENVNSENYHTIPIPRLQIPTGYRGKIVVEFEEKHYKNYFLLQCTDDKYFMYFWNNAYKDSWIEGIVTRGADETRQIRVSAKEFAKGVDHDYTLRITLLVASPNNVDVSTYSNMYEKAQLVSLTNIKNDGSKYREITGAVEHNRNRDYYKVNLRKGDKLTVDQLDENGGVSILDENLRHINSGGSLDSKMTTIYSEKDQVVFIRVSWEPSANYADKTIDGELEWWYTYENCGYPQSEEYVRNYKFRIYCSDASYYDELEPNDDIDLISEGKMQELSQRIGSKTKEAQPFILKFDNPCDQEFIPVQVNKGEKISIELSQLQKGASSIDDFQIHVYYDIQYKESESNTERNGNLESFENNNSGVIRGGVKSAVWVAPETETIYVELYNKKYSERRVMSGDSYQVLITKTNEFDNREITYEDEWSFVFDTTVQFSNDYINVQFTEDRIAETASDISGTAGVSNVSLDNQLDVDWYKFTPSQNSTKEIALFASNTEYIRDFAMVLANEDKQIIARGRDIVTNLVAGKTYYIGVTALSWERLKHDSGYGIVIDGANVPAVSVQGIKFLNDPNNSNRETNAKLGANRLSYTINRTSSTKQAQYTVRVKMGWDGEAQYQKAEETVVMKPGEKTATRLFDSIMLFDYGRDINVTIEVFERGIPAAKGAITKYVEGLNGRVDPQEISFQTPSQDEYYIFDDHPEHIRICDILDSGDPNYPPRSLMHSIALPPGKYTAFSYHHVDPSLYDTPIYFDAVFYNSGGRDGDVKINRVGFRAAGEIDNWNQRKAWEEYRDGKGNYGTKYINDDPLWLSDLMQYEHTINYKDNYGKPNGGVVHMMMEFEVVSGTVNFATVAYKNKGDYTQGGTAKYNFGPHGNEITSVYETLIPVSKGKAQAGSTVYAEPITFLIDDSTKSYLPVKITNDTYTKKQQKFFTTHSYLLDDNNRASTPKSSVFPLLYNGFGVTRDDQLIEDNPVPDKTEWIFDGRHTGNVASIEIPPDLRPYFGGKEEFEANDEIYPRWLKEIVAKDEWGVQIPAFQFLGGEEDIPGIVICPVPYELTHEYSVTVKNVGNEWHNLSYVVQGQEIDVNYMVIGEQGADQNNRVSIKQTEDKAQEIFGYWLKPGETIHCTIQVTMITGSNPTVHNAFVADITEEQKTADLLSLVEK